MSIVVTAGLFYLFFNRKWKKFQEMQTNNRKI